MLRPARALEFAWKVCALRCVCASVFVCVLVCASCARGREYELRGQILAVDPARHEVTIKHDDIRGFMPGMTMPFKVRNDTLLEGKAPGDLVRATLVVEGSEGYLTSLEATGRAPLTEPPPRPRVDLLTPGEAVPDVALIDQDGRPRRLSDWRGRTIALTFIYTRCPLPDFCPRMDRRFADVQQQLLGDAGLRERVHLLSISFDPAFDTAEVLAAHGKAVGARSEVWSLMTGDQAAIEQFAARFGVSVMRESATPADVVHNLRTAVIDGSGRLVAILSGTDWQPAELIAHLRNAVGKS